MTEVIEISGENCFKNAQDIAEFNRKQFPREPEQSKITTVGQEDPMAALRSQMKQRIYAFNSSAKESSSMKVAEFRAKFQDIKARIEASKSERQVEPEKPNYATLLTHLHNGADLISNIEGRRV